MRVTVSENAVLSLLQRENSLFIHRNSKSKALSELSARNWLRGVPMHWMLAWDTNRRVPGLVRPRAA